MGKHPIKLLLFIVGVAATAISIYVWHVYIFAILLSFQETGLVLARIARTFGLRRLQRPLWNFLTMIGVAWLVGSDDYGRFRRFFLNPIRAAYAWIYRTWLSWPWPIRVLTVLVIGVGV